MGVCLLASTLCLAQHISCCQGDLMKAQHNSTSGCPMACCHRWKTQWPSSRQEMSRGCAIRASLQNLLSSARLSQKPPLLSAPPYKTSSPQRASVQNLLSSARLSQKPPLLSAPPYKTSSPQRASVQNLLSSARLPTKPPLLSAPPYKTFLWPGSIYFFHQTFLGLKVGAFPSIASCKFKMDTILITGGDVNIYWFKI